MEGITDGIYRSTHLSMFSGMDKYFIPFISPTHGGGFTNRERKSLLNSEGMLPISVPQILTKDAQNFRETAEMLHGMGFQEVNLNLGCPSGTVTGKGKGAAMLAQPEVLHAFLDELFSHPLPCPVSVKTRLGFSDIGEWPGIVALLEEYPFSEIIVHARTRSEFYRGSAHPEAIALCTKLPTAYNGDVFTPETAGSVPERYPNVTALMLGRGIIANPNLGTAIRYGKITEKTVLKAFHDTLLLRYLDDRPQDAALGRMREIMSYMSTCFETSRKPFKRILKAKNVREYTDASDELFDCCDLKTVPYFDPSGVSSLGSTTPVI